MDKKIGVGLFGTKYHQVQEELVDNPYAELVAVAAFDKNLPRPLRDREDIAVYDTLDELLADDRVELVSLCSPRRDRQADEAVACMEAGRHVYAEKPCALTEEALDRLVEVSSRTGRSFREMCNTAFEEPYFSIRKLVMDGVIGEVVQVLAQKSYPYVDRRPQDEGVDGGLLMQVGVHALRFVEHVACCRIERIDAVETKLGNPKEGDLHMAASFMMKLENGGVASAVANYLNQPGFGSWGNESLRIFGTKGFVEAVDAGTSTRLIVGEEDRGPVSTEPGERENHFTKYLKYLLGISPMEMSLEEELHPTRMVIRAKRAAARWE